MHSAWWSKGFLIHTGVLVFCSEQLAVLLQPLVCLLFWNCSCNHFENLLLVHLLPYVTCLLPDHINHLVQVLPWELYKQGRTDTHSHLVHQQSCQKLILRCNPKYQALLTPLPLMLAVPIHIPCFHLAFHKCRISREFCYSFTRSWHKSHKF